MEEGNNTMKRLIIFDLDGTLLNTLGDLTCAVNYALKQCGFLVQHTPETVRTFVGNGIGKLLERSLPEHHNTEEIMQQMRQSFFPYYQEHGAELTAPYEGIIPLLEQLQARGIRLAVASNKVQDATEALVHHYFPTIHFAHIYGQRPDVPIKPDPTIVYEILDEAGVDKSEVLYVGDSDVDMLTAQNAQISAIGVSWGFRHPTDLIPFSPLAIIDEANELLRYID